MTTTRREDVDNDLAKLSNLENNAILHRLRERYKEGKIYIYIGDVVIAINPFKTIPGLYRPELLDHYKTARDAPHIYWTANEAYRRLCDEQINQCIIVTGDSGSGKTESTKHLLNCLVKQTTCRNTKLVEKLNSVNPLIELFGNACTVLNRNSSRFGKFIELLYQRDGSLVGGKLRTFVLEKSRVVHHRRSEKNFHVFYALFAGIEEHDLQNRFFLETPNEYRIMVDDEVMPHKRTGVFKNPDEREMYRKQFVEIQNILLNIEFDDNDVSEIWKVLAACLHLGNIDFEQIYETTDGVGICDDLPLRNAVVLLGLEDTEETIFAVNEILISRTIIAKGQPVQKLLNKQQAEDIRDSIVKGLYSGIFRAIIDQINTNIHDNRFSATSRHLSVGLLDISGFESLQENSLEQLFINVTNEQIQQYHQQQIFEDENRAYEEEGINLQPNSFTDNEDVLKLIFGKPGILSVLDDQMKVGAFNDSKLVDTYDNHFDKKSAVYQKSRQHISFGIVHYAGEVTYCAKNFLAKNRGTIPEKLKEFFIERSDNYIVNEYFDVQDSFSTSKVSGRESLGKKKARQIRERYNAVVKAPAESQNERSATNTTSSHFIKSLSCLQDVLADSKPLFVRCIKPNNEQQEDNFNEKVVLKQLQSSGIEDVTRVRREGYQIRVTHNKLFKMCQIFHDMGVYHDNDDLCEKGKKIFDHCRVDKSLYQIGHTKVFLKGDAMDLVRMKKAEMIKEKEELEKEKHRQEIEAKRQVELNFRETNSMNDIPPSYNNDVEVNDQRQDRTEDTFSLHSISSSHSETSGHGASSIHSQPPTYEDVEDQNKRNEQKRMGWDAPRITEKDFEGCLDCETTFLKFCRFFMYFGLIMGILFQGCGTILVPLLKVTKLHKDQDLETQSVAMTELVICYSVPVALTFIQSMFKICLGRMKTISFKHLLPVLLLETAEVCGTAYLVLKVLPYHSTTSGITLVMCSYSCPAVLNILKQFNLAQHRQKFFTRIICVGFSIISMILQVGVLLFLILSPNLVFSDKDTMDTKYNKEDSIWLFISLIGISLGSIQNFFSCDIKIGCLHFNIRDWRIVVDKARPKINMWICPIKVGVFLGMTKILIPDASLTLDYGRQISSDSKDLFDFATDHGLMYIYIYCTIFTSYKGILACKLHMQRFAFYIPLITVPLVCFGSVIGYCYKWPEANDILDGAISCPTVDNMMWIGCSTGLWVSLVLLTWHVLFTQHHRMERHERLFILPTRDSFFSALGLLMQRKDDIVENLLQKHAKFKPLTKGGNENGGRKHQDEQRKSKKKTRPYVYVCATMWHETRQEMLQLLKSLFRLDFHRNKYKMAEKIFKAEVDYFEQEFHIIFDDAFETNKKSKQRMTNDWVKQLVKCIEDAAMSVAKGRLKWNASPVKTSTPYGGRLTWTLPGGTLMVFHLKDKDKIRHRKRWSQIMYMYYLLGYKMLGAVPEELLLEKDTDKRYHYRRVTSLLNQLPKDKIKKAHHSFILALDGDVDFKPEAVQKLIDKMAKNEKVGAVCGRIHPIGSGPVVWYQQFEYAIGHWLQKASEHVFGCVLCCPGAFSLFRATALLDDNMMRMYTTPPTEAKHFIQFEQGEDRWLCTLMLQQGWKIDYAASADAFTFAPETFHDFFVQRRRWAPSTLANIIDLLSSWRITTKINDNISTLFIFYQSVLMASSLLGIGTVTLMITGSFNAVLKLTMTESYIVAIAPIVLYAVVCIKCNNDKQITLAALLSTIYTVVMVIVTVGLFVNITTEAVYSPNIIFFSEIVFIFITTGLAHPKEIYCLVHGLLYYLMVPSTFIFLTVYYMCNIHVVSWGTREKKSEDDETDIKQQETEKKQKPPILLRCLQRLGVFTLMKEITKFIKQILGAKIEKDHNEQNSTSSPVEVVIPLPREQKHVKPKVPKKLDPNAWQASEYLGPKEKDDISQDEKDFWKDILGKYLHPIQEDKKKKEEIENELKSLRNNVAFGFLMLNLLFATAVFQLQNNEDQLKKMYILNEYEPISVAFILIFALVILFQYIGMLIHRWGTFLHLISSVRLRSLSKALKETPEEYAKKALKEADNLQSAAPEADYEETLSVSGLSVDSRISNDTHENFEPDYPEGELNPDYPGDNNNEYEQNFIRRFETIRQNYNTRPRINNLNSNIRDAGRAHFYHQTFGRRAGRMVHRQHEA